MVPKKRGMKVADATIARLSIYNRALTGLLNAGTTIVSSEDLASRLGAKTSSQHRISAAQIRKDLSHIGALGEAGKGYYVTDLKDALGRFLGIDRIWNCALIGAGHLGSALLSYPGFRQTGFNITAVFDNDIRKIGKKWEDILIQDISELEETVVDRDIRICIMTVPADVSQETADMLVAAGIRAILNFAPAHINVPEGVELRHADLSKELECLSFFLSNDATVRTKDLNGGRKQ